MAFDPSFEDDQVIIPGAIPAPPLGVVTFNPDFCYNQPTDVDLQVVVPVPTTGFDVATFRLLFPAFASTTAYPDVMLENWYTMATAYIDTDVADGYEMTVAQRALAVNMMVAHITVINDRITKYGTAAGINAGFVTMKSAMDVRYSIKAPEESGAFAQWLALTPYGLQLSALLEVCSIGGRYIGGAPVRAGFRGYSGFYQ